MDHTIPTEVSATRGCCVTNGSALRSSLQTSTLSGACADDRNIILVNSQAARYRNARRLGTDEWPGGWPWGFHEF